MPDVFVLVLLAFSFYDILLLRLTFGVKWRDNGKKKSFVLLCLSENSFCICSCLRIRFDAIRWVCVRLHVLWIFGNLVDDLLQVLVAFLFALTKIKRSEKWKRWNDGILIEKWLWNVVSLHSTADGIFAQCRVKIVKHKSGTMVDCCILHRVIYSAFVILHKAKINSFTMESEEFHSAKAFDVKSFSEKKLFLN